MGNNSPYQKTIQERQIKNKRDLITTFKEMPIIEVAVKRVGISRDTYYRWRKEDKEFLEQSQDAIFQGIDFINDMSESQVVTLIKEKKKKEIVLWLKHNSPKYMGKGRDEKEDSGPSVILLTDN